MSTNAKTQTTVTIDPELDREVIARILSRAYGGGAHKASEVADRILAELSE